MKLFQNNRKSQTKPQVSVSHFIFLNCLWIWDNISVYEASKRKLWLKRQETTWRCRHTWKWWLGDNNNSLVLRCILHLRTFLLLIVSIKLKSNKYYSLIWPKNYFKIKYNMNLSKVYRVLLGSALFSFFEIITTKEIILEG